MVQHEGNFQIRKMGRLQIKGESQMKLYEIDEQIERCIHIPENDEYVDTETGEVFDREYIEHLEMDRDIKIEYLIKLYKNKLSDSEALKKEADDFAKRSKSLKNAAEGIKEYLNFCLKGEKFKSADGLHQITFRKSQSVEVTDISKLKDCYLRYKEPEADKTAIKEAIKSGIDVSGAVLVDKLSPSIK